MGSLRHIVSLGTKSQDTSAQSSSAMMNETGWQQWLLELFPGTYTGPLAPYHEDFWEWLWECTPGEPSRPYVAVWPRGWAKSTNGEVGAVALGAKGYRYVLYVSSRQQQADDHV